MSTTIRMLDLDTGEIQDVETKVRSKKSVEDQEQENQDEEYDDEEYEDEEYEDESSNPPGVR